jgi:hypothetical protein
MVEVLTGMPRWMVVVATAAAAMVVAVVDGVSRHVIVHRTRPSSKHASAARALRTHCFPRATRTPL